MDYYQSSYTGAQVDGGVEKAYEHETTKANIDGSYAGMSVGLADQLNSSIRISDKVPYNIRSSGGDNNIGNRLNDTIVGGTVAWNQLAKALTATNVAAVNASVSFNEGTMTLTPSAINGGADLMIPVKKDHKYYIFADVENASASTTTQIYLRNAYGSETTSFITGSSTTSRQTIKSVVSPSFTDSNGTMRIRAVSGAGNAITVYSMMCIDLTLMFGAAIADHVYSLEQANTGAGVAWFKALFPKDYYAYNAGELMSVKTTGHKTIGFNAYNHTIGTAKLIGGKKYQISGTYTSVTYTDVSGNSEVLTIDANGKFTPTNNGTLAVTGGNATNTCVHLVWDGERDDEFEEYVERVYALDGDLELRGVPKLDAGNNLYYDGDVYESDGTVTRNYYAYTFTGNESAGAYGQGFYVTIDRQGVGEIFAGLRKSTDGNDFYTASVKDIFYTASQATGKVAFKITGVTSAQGLQDYLAGKTMLFKTSSPTTETADAYQNPQIVDDWGTEEYIDNRAVAIPVGHDTLYMANLKSKLEMAPDSPSQGDGDYVVRQTSGINEYTKLIIPTELPAMPSSDGIYRLKCTVADGVATLSWEALI